MEELLILLNISERKRLQVYLHWTNYPSAKKYGHDVCLGALPTEPLGQLLADRERMEPFIEEVPFVYDPEVDKAVYTGRVERKDKLEHPAGQKYEKMQLKVDAIKLASVTTWLPSQSQ